MFFDWNCKSADIGYYEMVLRHSNGEEVPATDVSLWDFTCPFQREKVKADPRMREVAFKWNWCHGWLHREEHKISENITLKDVQREIEIWTMRQFINSYKSALDRVEKLKPYAEWAERRMKDEEISEATRICVTRRTIY